MAHVSIIWLYLLTTSGFSKHLHVMVVGHPLDGGLALLIELTYASSGVHLRGKREKIKVVPVVLQRQLMQ